MKRVKDFAKRIKRFNEFANIDESRLIPDKADVATVESMGLPLDNVLKLIYAPDPQTGIPRSDLAVMMSKDARPEVAQYIQSKLMSSQPDSVRAGDADTALEFTKNHGETLAESFTLFIRQ